jgi:hypothetical protein
VRFAAVFEKKNSLPGPELHFSIGNRHAFADPENAISFAYVMNQMEQSVLPDEKSPRLVDSIYE